MMVSWKGKMALRRTLVIAGTLSLLTLSLLSSAYVTNLGTSVYCDYFSLDACKTVQRSSSPGNAVPSPPTLPNVPDLPPVRNYSDAEMSAFVLAKDLLSRPPYPVEKAKIAFMFLTAGPLPFEFVWEKFFEVTMPPVLSPLRRFLWNYCLWAVQTVWCDVSWYSHWWGMGLCHPTFFI